ncbi:MAG TPA: hypothetical protein PKJ84_15660, partial [Anaerolineales bacterium]|nr:hypothetical protein [Anaerolineales bacterium]
MFNLFKKKEPKQSDPFLDMRTQFMGNVNFNEWPKGDSDAQPWSLFVAARKAYSANNHAEAEKYLRQVTETPDLEPRHYLQAWLFLRHFLKVQPPAEIAKKVYGVMVEVGTPTGVMAVVGYTDHKARTLHSSGGGTVWERPNASMDDKVDALIKAGENAVQAIPLVVVDIVPAPPKQADHVLICIATPSGI